MHSSLDGVNLYDIKSSLLPNLVHPAWFILQDNLKQLNICEFVHLITNNTRKKRRTLATQQLAI